MSRLKQPWRSKRTDPGPGSSAHLLDLRGLSKVQSFPASYDVIILSKSKWNSLSQGFPELARRFARGGHRVFYTFIASSRNIKTRVRPVADGIFQVELSNLDPKTISSDPFTGQRLIMIQGVFDSLRKELAIVDAVCFVELPVWESVAFSLREEFNWKIVYAYTGELSRAGNASEGLFHAHERLIQHSDLRLVSSPGLLAELKNDPNCVLIPSPASGTSSGKQDAPARSTWENAYEQIQQKIPGLFSKASIIVVTYNNLEYTRLCLQSIYEKTIYPNFEVIVVDNASSDGTREFLHSFEAEHKHIQILCNAKNEGFACANNQGIARAQGDLIVLLNNDTVVTRVWLSRLISYLRDEEVGLVGPVANGIWNKARVEMPFTDLSALDRLAMKFAGEGPNRLTPIKMLAMYCVVGRRRVFQQIGPLDEQFGIGMFEDDDYSLRMRQAGYKIAVAEDVFIHHFGQSGFRLLGDERYLALLLENRQKFEAKWNIKWEYDGGDTLTENRTFAADLQAILDTYPERIGAVIFPPTTGWNISLFQPPHRLQESFARMGFLVFLCTDVSTEKDRGFEQVQPGVYRFNGPWAVFDLLEHPVILTLSYNREYLFQLRRPFVVYEFTEDPALFPGDETRLQKNHELLLKEADLIVAASDRLIEQVRQIRPDVIIYGEASRSKLAHPQASELQFPLDQVRLVLQGYEGTADLQEEKDDIPVAFQAGEKNQSRPTTAPKPDQKGRTMSSAGDQGVGRESRLDVRNWILRRGMHKIISLLKKIKGKRHLEEDLSLIRSSGLFDEAWYLMNNPDVSQAKVDPLRHYLYYGGFEGRDPGPQFSSFWYLNTYADVKQAGMNPLLHYLKYGRAEKRAPRNLNPSVSSRVVRNVIEILNKRSLKGIFVVTSAFIFDESFNQRVINLSKFLSKQGWGVIYIAWRWQESEPMSSIGEEVYKNIFQVPVDMFLKDPDAFAQVQHAQKYFVVEFPYPGFFPSALQLRHHGFELIYEIIDEWEEFHKVGQAIWFNKTLEQAFVINANLVTAITPSLIEKFGGLRQDIHHSPNGYTPALLGEDHRNIARKKQMQKREMHLGYFGHLTESWFDWDFLLRILDLAEKQDFNIYVHLIGYGEPDLQATLKNYSDRVKFYGKIHPSELYRHVKGWDAAMIFFKSGKLSEAVDPIKIYEYLYFGLPTIVKGISHLKDFPFTHVVLNEYQVLDTLLALQEQALKHPKKSQEALIHAEQMLIKSTWEQRFVDLLGFLESEGHMAF